MAAPPDAIAVLDGLAPEASRRSEAQQATGGSCFVEGGRRGFEAEARAGSARVYALKIRHRNFETRRRHMGPT
jgi:hypothetical protein